MKLTQPPDTCEETTMSFGLKGGAVLATVLSVLVATPSAVRAQGRGGRAATTTGQAATGRQQSGSCQSGTTSTGTTSSGTTTSGTSGTTSSTAATTALRTAT